jgi:hypothetical protein
MLGKKITEKKRIVGGNLPWYVELETTKCYSNKTCAVHSLLVGPVRNGYTVICD